MITKPLEPLRSPCDCCGGLDGYIIAKGGQQCMYCARCDRFQYNKPREKPRIKGYETLARLHKVTKNGRTFYAGKIEDHCPDCGVVCKHDVYLFEQDDGSFTLNRKEYK